MYKTLVLGVVAILNLWSAVTLFGLDKIELQSINLQKFLNIISSVEFEIQQILAIAVIVLSVFVAMRFVWLRNFPISFPSTAIDIRIDDKTPRKYRVTRSQIVRANRPNVTAIYTQLMPAPRGRVLDTVHGMISCAGEELDCWIESLGSPETGWRCHQIIPGGLPHPWFSIFIPNRLLATKYDRRMKFVQKCAARRLFVTDYDELNAVTPPFYELNAGRYKYKNVTIRLIIPATAGSDLTTVNEKITAELIRAAAVQAVALDLHELDGGGYGATLHLKKLKRELVHIRWQEDLFDPPT